ncbi:unnamed protein product [Cuscuta epithymum]|uniref:Uncharacterized protein n=1 Tax=Cuscuta epithymum TaxID=186058 RepID=A0AAV0C6I6_9ASTE|nr:unnamed protein product [Cuscuta epithymum]
MAHLSLPDLSLQKKYNFCIFQKCDPCPTKQPISPSNIIASSPSNIMAHHRRANLAPSSLLLRTNMEDGAKLRRREDLQRRERTSREDDGEKTLREDDGDLQRRRWRPPLRHFNLFAAAVGFNPFIPLTMALIDKFQICGCNYRSMVAISNCWCKDVSPVMPLGGAGWVRVWFPAALG